MSGATGFVWHERYAWHNPGPGALYLPPGGFLEPDIHVEDPAPKRRFRNLLDASGLLAQLTPIAPRLATPEELARFHDSVYVERIERLSQGGGGDAGDGQLGNETPFGRDGYEIARLAVGGCLEAVDAVLHGRVRNAYALVRPPGHHARRATGGGFCIFANVPLAALHARQQWGVARVAIVDWDVHHGNGAQEGFWTDPSVLTISIHQDNAYPPGSGTLAEVGAGPGEGFNLNVPLPPGSGVGAYLAAMAEVVVPALALFRPELILVASGLDANALDPMARMMLHSDGYREMTRLVMAAADTTCDGRLVLCQEGGYSPAHVPFCGLAIVEQLSGIRTGVVDPFLGNVRAWGGQDLQPHQAQAIAAAAGNTGLMSRARSRSRLRTAHGDDRLP